MSVEKIKQLLELMNDNELVEMELEEDNFKVKLKKPGANVTMVPAASAPAPAVAPAPGAAAQATANAPAPAADVTDPNLVSINSPIVGTFYRAPSPEAEPFASEGTAVKEGSVVCIIEAMKIMNEVKSDVTGIIEKILVENGDPVEYGQPLYLVRP